MNPATSPAILVDYGEVISEPQPTDAVAAMAALAGLDSDVFVERYWAHRPGYDRGCTASAFWGAVAGAELARETVAHLVQLDTDAWSHLNADTLAVLSTARERGASLSLLSNAPHELADALDRHPAFRGFDHLIFSARIGVAKPDRAAFEAAISALGRDPAEILFIDDRRSNVDAARAVGLRALHFTTASALRRELAF